MGFAETSAALLRSNRRLLGNRRKMNDSHLNKGKSSRKMKAVNSSGTQTNMDEFRLEKEEKQRNEQGRIIIFVTVLIVLSVLIGILFLSLK